jgi:hypothetical protein
VSVDGTVSVTVAPVASLGPALAATIVYAMGALGVVLARRRSW